jgi:hypothetical protein
MEILTGTPLPRRTFLKGMGATVALPFLDAMVPIGRLSRLATAADPVRLVCIEMVHGAAGCSPYGASQHLWVPELGGRSFDLAPTALSPLERYRDYLTIISNTDVRMAEAYAPEETGGDHFRSSAVFLTQAHPTQTESSDIFAGTSIDQLYARRFGQSTPIPSMQLCIENVDRAGGCAYGYSCVYTDSISWASPTEPLPMIRDPRVAFDQLFGAGGTAEERAARRKTAGSILDWITGRVSDLKRELNAADRQRMDQYLENIREIERRIQRIEARNTSGEARELPGAPAGVPDSFEDHMKLMFDLQVLAFEADMTRVFSFKTGRDASARVYPESGVAAGFHPASHHGNNPRRVTDFYQINKYHVGLLPYFLDRLKATLDGDVPLLEKTAVVYGSPMADGNTHNHRRCPLIVLGRANGRLHGDLHLRAPDGTPMANAFLSLMHALGVDDMHSFGDSSGEFPLVAPTGA